MSYKIIMLTNGSPQGFNIVEKLRNKNIEFNSTILESKLNLKFNFKKKKKNNKNFFYKLAKWFVRIYRHLNFIIQYKKMNTNLLVTGHINSKKMIEDLRKLSPDFIILGGMGIINKEVIKSANIAVINSHPALLPWLRGCGVVGRAILDDIPVGATIHYVLPDVDTGNIIERRLLNLSDNQKHLSDNQKHLSDYEKLNYDLSAELLADVISELLKGNIPEGIEQKEKFPVSKYLTQDERIIADQKIQNGLQKVDLESWIKENSKTTEKTCL